MQELGPTSLDSRSCCTARAGCHAFLAFRGPPRVGTGLAQRDLLWLFSHSAVSNSATPGTAARQASLSFTLSQSWLRLVSIESVMPSNLSSSSPSPPAVNLSQHQGLFQESISEAKINHTDSRTPPACAVLGAQGSVGLFGPCPALSSAAGLALQRRGALVLMGNQAEQSFMHYSLLVTGAFPQIPLGSERTAVPYCRGGRG